MKIICLVTAGRLFEIGYGGEQRFTRSFGEWLTRHGRTVIVLASTFTSVKARLVSLVNETTNPLVPPNPRKIRTLNPPYPVYLISRLILSILYIIKIINLSSKSSILVLHSQDTGYSGLSAVISGKILKIPVIVTSHGIRHKTLELTIRSNIKQLLLRIEYWIDIFSVKNADVVIAVSPLIKNYFESKVRRKVEFVPIAIKLKRFIFSEQKRTKFRNEFNIGEDRIVVGSVGRLSVEKNLCTLVSSFAKACNTFPNLTLMFVGAGLLEDRLKVLSNELGIQEKVIFLGTRYDIDNVMAGLDIFVLPSFTEGMSTSLLEAMASGRAVICSDIGPNREIVKDNYNGILVDPYNIDEIKTALEHLIKDKNIRSHLGKNAVSTALEYDEERVFPRILQIYDSLVVSPNN